jgi:hypothetical protein
MGASFGGSSVRQEMESPRPGATVPRAKDAVGYSPSTALPSTKKWRERKAIVEFNSDRIVVGGKNLQTLLALVGAGPRGITALEVSTWAYRLAGYCHTLRRLGVPIVTYREAHEGGWHGRYRLEGKVKLHPVTTA